MGDHYPEVNVKVATLADLEGKVDVVVLLKGLEEATALASRDDHVEGSNGLEGHQEGDSKEGELVEHGGCVLCCILVWASVRVCKRGKVRSV